MKNIIAIKTNIKYLQFIISLNKAISKNKDFVFDGGSFEMMIQEVLGPLYEVKNLMMVTSEKLEENFNALFESKKTNQLSEYMYNLEVDAKVFIANQDAKILVDNAFARYEDLISIIEETNPALVALLPSIKEAEASLKGYNTYSKVNVESAYADNKTIQMFG
jgi:predicted mannosyl-3-phosphoglycerate phosphatase (HAD superfamily)